MKRRFNHPNNTGWLIGWSNQPYSQVNKSSQISNWPKWLIEWLKNQQRQPLEKPNQKRGNHSINHGDWIPIRSTLVVYSSRPSTSAAQSTMFTTRNNHSIKQINQPIQQPDQTSFNWVKQQDNEPKNQVGHSHHTSCVKTTKCKSAIPSLAKGVVTFALKCKQHANWMNRNPLYLDHWRPSHAHFPQLWWANYCSNTADKSLN